MDQANEALALVDGVPDGLSLADWAKANDVGKTTSYAFGENSQGNGNRAEVCQEERRRETIALP